MNLDLAGYHLTYDQEFTVPSDFTVSPNGTVGFKSQFDWGGRYNPSNNEAEFYSDPSFGANPFVVQNGELTINAKPADPNGPYDGQPYTSGLITTQNTFSQHGGYFEVRADVSGGSGTWPAFWMLPTTLADYPEIDILEDPNLGPKDQYFLHETAPDLGGGGFVSTGTKLSNGYHTYGVEWNDLTTTFYFDHVAIAECATPPQLAKLNMYLLANLAVGGNGSWPGPPGARSIPAHYRIDYIRVFSKDSSVPAVPQQPISSPDGANTLPILTQQPLPTVYTGTGPDTVTMRVNEDYYVGDAQFSVTIDGTPMGGTYTAIAERGHGQVQNFVFAGNFAPGTHTVSVNYLNDNYGGEPYLDRNLYVLSAKLNGAAIPNSYLNEQNDGVQSFTFTVAAGAKVNP